MGHHLTSQHREKGEEQRDSSCWTLEKCQTRQGFKGEKRGKINAKLRAGRSERVTAQRSVTFSKSLKPFFHTQKNTLPFLCGKRQFCQGLECRKDLSRATSGICLTC